MLLELGNKFALNKDMLTVSSCGRARNGGRKWEHRGRLTKEISGGQGSLPIIPRAWVPTSVTHSSDNLIPGCQSEGMKRPFQLCVSLM